MNHTKRTEEFTKQIRTLKNVLDALSETLAQKPEWLASIKAIGQILDKNTTDAPCIVKAADNEPIFVLRGQDDTADTFVSLWGERTRAHAANLTETNPAYGGLLAKAQDALLCAAEMRQFPNRKRPD